MSLDDYNYYNDSRNRARRTAKWYDSFDEKAMTVEVIHFDDEDEEIATTLPVKFEVDIVSVYQQEQEDHVFGLL